MRRIQALVQFLVIPCLFRTGLGLGLPSRRLIMIDQTLFWSRFVPVVAVTWTLLTVLLSQSCLVRTQRYYGRFPTSCQVSSELVVLAGVMTARTAQ